MNQRFTFEDARNRIRVGILDGEGDLVMTGHLLYLKANMGRAGVTTDLGPIIERATNLVVKLPPTDCNEGSI